MLGLFPGDAGGALPVDGACKSFRPLAGIRPHCGQGKPQQGQRMPPFPTRDRRLPDRAVPAGDQDAVLLEHVEDAVVAGRDPTDPEPGKMLPQRVCSPLADHPEAVFGHPSRGAIAVEGQFPLLDQVPQGHQ